MRVPPVARRPSWAPWLRRWDEQQERFNPAREQRFRAMLDLLEVELGPRFHVLDLGSGPGSLSVRILRRFPAARVTAVDYDPVVLRVGRGALGSMGGRLRWVEARLGAPDWTVSLPPGRYDGAVSTTALHWLSVPELSRLYSDLAHLLRRGGVFLNGDHLPWGPGEPQLVSLGSKVRTVRTSRREPGRGRETWRRWWEEARRLPELRSEFVEHDRRFDRRLSLRPPRANLTLDRHVRMLKAVGFRPIATIWQEFEDRVLFARRGPRATALD